MKLIAWFCPTTTPEQSIRIRSSDDEEPAHKHGWWSWQRHRSIGIQASSAVACHLVCLSACLPVCLSRFTGWGDRHDVVSPYHRVTGSPYHPFAVSPYRASLFSIWSSSDADANHLQSIGWSEHWPINAVQPRQLFLRYRQVEVAHVRRRSRPLASPSIHRLFMISGSWFMIYGFWGMTTLVDHEDGQLPSLMLNYSQSLGIYRLIGLG